MPEQKLLSQLGEAKGREISFAWNCCLCLTPKHGSDRDQKLIDPVVYFEMLYFLSILQLIQNLFYLNFPVPTPKWIAEVMSSVEV
jgi:hypothetical protein